MSKSSLQITGRKGEWYVVDPSGRMETCGPYETKDEADDDRRGLEAFWRDNGPTNVGPENTAKTIKTGRPSDIGRTSDAPAGMLF